MVLNDIDKFIKPVEYLIEVEKNSNSSECSSESLETVKQLCHLIGKGNEKLDKNGFKVYPRQIVIQAYNMMSHQ